MSVRILSLQEFKLLSDFQFFPGNWILEYSDRTHLPKNFFIPIGSIEIENRTRHQDVFFYFRPRSHLSLAGVSSTGQESEVEQEFPSFFQAWNQNSNSSSKKEDIKKDSGKAAKIILDQLNESMTRLGLIQSELEIDDEDFIETRRFALIIADTNALRDGAIRCLKERFKYAQLWIVIPLVSLMEIGERVAYVTSRDRDGCNLKNYALIRIRPQVTIAPQEVTWIKKNFPTETLELSPELLRSFRAFEVDKGVDKQPDRISVNDRLILEGIKNLRRERGMLEGVYLISSDKDFSRLARLEGIKTIYPASPRLETFSNGIYSLRYSLEAQTYVCCSIHRFLWDLAHIFGRIRIRCISGQQQGLVLELFYYYPTKLVNDWVDGKLEVMIGSSSATEDA